MNLIQMEVIAKLYRQMEKNRVLTAIRQGMLLAVPFIMAGSIALLLLSIPVPKYQIWLHHIFHGNLYQVLLSAHAATLNCISLVILVTIALSYESLCKRPYAGVVPMVSVCSYVAFTAGGNPENLSVVFQSTWLFHAIICVITSSVGFVWLQDHLPKGKRSYTDGEDDFFQYVIASVIPAAVVIGGFALVNRILYAVWGTTDMRAVFGEAGNFLFRQLGGGLWSGLLFLFLMHGMWFFGIHGSNVLDGVAKTVFNTGLEVNLRRMTSGLMPTEVISKTFFDTFVLFGGCGSLLCLVAAILLVEKNKSIRRLTKVAFLPTIFNMNELLLFGLPIVLNPIYLIPFVATPLLLAVISYLATIAGLVPYVTHAVEWTTPIVLSGYVATGSTAGSILQLVNLAVGTAIYIPFVRMAHNSNRIQMREHMEQLTQKMQQNEERGLRESLIDRSDAIGAAAKSIAGNLQNAIQTEQIQLFYQPQMDYTGRLQGAEALLRWKYDADQYLYPPLVIALAEESGQMKELGDYIVYCVCRDLKRIAALAGLDFELSMNLTAGQLIEGSVFEQIQRELERNQLNAAQLGLELTEQTALMLPPEVKRQLEGMHRLGMPIIMDDFGMGHSSMMYLRENRFDVVKLDGSIVRDIMENKRSRDIISSIIYLSESLDFQVIAEYVETKEQQKVLEELGCLMYQGYLYGKPVPVEEFLEKL